MSNEQQVYEFLKGSRNCTAKELANGLCLPLETVQSVLDVVVHAGEVIRIDGDGAQNTARYNLAGMPTPVVETPTAQWKSTEQLWPDRERARVLSEEKLKNPPPQPKRYTPTDAEVESEMVERKSVKPLTPEERQQIKLMEGRTPRNPQIFVKS
jgi:hypothetical protein